MDACTCVNLTRKHIPDSMLIKFMSNRLKYTETWFKMRYSIVEIHCL